MVYKPGSYKSNLVEEMHWYIDRKYICGCMQRMGAQFIDTVVYKPGSCKSNLVRRNAWYIDRKYAVDGGGGSA